MLDIAFDCLFQFLRRFYISASTVSRRTPQVFVLSQLLSDSDLSRAVSFIFFTKTILRTTFLVGSNLDRMLEYTRRHVFDIGQD